MPAARRRDRRGAGGRDQPTQHREGRSTVRSRSLSIRLLFTSLLLLLLAVVAIAALFIVYRGDESGIKGTAPPSLSVYERGLVKPNVDYHEILAENSRFSENTSRRHFPNPVLAYVTPWNSRGYEMAKLFGSKLTHISPIWYELKSEGKKLVLEGRHNVDKEWISELWNNGHPLVLPRVVLEASPMDLLLKKKQWNKAIDIIIKECKDMGYDGIVLESWSRWAAYGILHDPDLRNMALDFIKQLGKALHSVDLTRRTDDHKLELIYVIPAPRSPNLNEYDFGPRDLQQLCDAVDGFSLMTYDFSGPQSPGPNAPLNWVHTSLSMLVGDSDAKNHARKILLGLNFYGNDFLIPEGGGEAITGRDYISLLEKHKPVLRWDNISAEHFFVYPHNYQRHTVFYPSLISLSTRLEEARAWGAGISIWEIGQGLDYFFDLL
ncbi:chitinase domain-containing protein 1-like isoform X1 [Zingiber officinale]|uniref:chitinase domain-containing protein 1-like isoform X1 n=1 Tax=Zingiber officinale TaxID=94328 RepID=UPI001C4B207C|nr:chitinase domain-containing protein 1-like isoform X1 [Zingiber officinale]